MKEKFLDDVSSHEMRVLHKDGLYRHLRFRRADSRFYWFDIVTWPGHLTVTGDMGTYVFTRTEDMFTFFRGDRVNPQYWAEKEKSGTSLKMYSSNIFKKTITEHAEENYLGEDFKGLHVALQDMLDHCYWEEEEESARRALDSFQFEDFRFDDAWEFDFTEYKYHYLWCLHAIVWAIQKWDEKP